MAQLCTDLKSRSDVFVQQIVNKHGETLKMCTDLFKINKRNKKQQRLFVVTDKAIYNVKGKQVKRRIALSQITSITKSAKGKQFTIHIPSEYDYRLEAIHVRVSKEIISAISEAIDDLKQEFFIHTIETPDTAIWTVTKTDLKQFQHHDEAVRTVMALTHLCNMGFKSKMARKSLKQNKGNLQHTIHALVGDYMEELEHDEDAPVISPFRRSFSAPFVRVQKVGRKPVSIETSTSSPLSPFTPNELKLSSSCTEIDDKPYAFVNSVNNTH